mmetsp:Transcript_18178/g.51352  ORF Transcript_18178/g.51352 Transcript_18178/m.51352 type:complete len:218 (-) Transcript_18178:1042-1695(-)
MPHAGRVLTGQVQGRHLARLKRTAATQPRFHDHQRAQKAWARVGEFAPCSHELHGVEQRERHASSGTTAAPASAAVGDGATMLHDVRDDGRGTAALAGRAVHKHAPTPSDGIVDEGGGLSHHGRGVVLVAPLVRVVTLVLAKLDACSRHLGARVRAFHAVNHAAANLVARHVEDVRDAATRGRGLTTPQAGAAWEAWGRISCSTFTAATTRIVTGGH